MIDTMNKLIQISLLLTLLVGSAIGLQDTPQTNLTSTSRRLFTYAGPLLPSDWSL